MKPFCAKTFVWCTSLAAAICLAAIAQAGETSWGNLSGRFVYDGEPSPVRMIKVTQDAKAFGPTIADESLVVHPKNRGLANVIVYILPKKDQKVAIHPSYEKTANAKVKHVFHKGRFEPHVLLLRTTQTMVQKNLDPVPHNANIAFVQNRGM